MPCGPIEAYRDHRRNAACGFNLLTLSPLNIQDTNCEVHSGNGNSVGSGLIVKAVVHRMRTVPTVLADYVSNSPSAVTTINTDGLFKNIL